MKLIQWDSLLPMSDLFAELPSLSDVGWDLAADVYVEDGAAVVELQMPGIEADAYEVSVADGQLHISGSREKRVEEGDRAYVRQEIQRGAFSRIVQLPEGEWDADALSASKADGTLRVVIPQAS